MPAPLPQKFLRGAGPSEDNAMAVYSVDSLPDNCYPGTTVLVNKLDIQDQADLDAVESTLVSAKAALWEVSPPVSSFDFAHYCAIHRFLFEDLYDWAGTPRTINIAKKGTSFCPASQIKAVADAVFLHLSEENYLQGLDKTSFTAALVDFYERTNELHPFREGNGRTQRLFLSQLADHAGYRLDFARVDPDDLMIATIQAANGVNIFLKELFGEMIFI